MTSLDGYHDSTKTWLTNTELADRLGVSLGTVRRWRVYGHGPLGVRVGKYVRYAVEDVVAWEDERRQAERDRFASRAVTLNGYHDSPDVGEILANMLLTEPGSRVEGTTEEILRVLFWTVHTAAVEKLGMSDVQADEFATAVLPRLHGELAQRGHIVRDYPSE